MPINFVTGLPRQGKTLWTIVTVKARAEKENRQVYTCNIPGVTIPGWQTIAHPDEWMTLPDEAIIVVDELQDFWGKAPNGSKVPEPILELSKHGKRGIDFYFITQEPDLVHSTPRSLCQHHYFVIRAFGTETATVRKFERMQIHPEKVKKQGEVSVFRYPKEAFGVKDPQTGEYTTPPWYKSADVHNIKRQLPLKLLWIPGAVVMLIVCIYYAITMFSGGMLKGSGLDKAKGGPVGQVIGGPAGQQAPQQPAAPMTPAQYAAAYQPRIPGLAYSAPAYDKLTEPKQAPVPAACIESKSKGCKCYTQIGTPYDASPAMCSNIVHNGIFLPFDTPPGQQVQQQVQAQQTQQAQAAPAAAASPAARPDAGLLAFAGASAGRLPQPAIR